MTGDLSRAALDVYATSARTPIGRDALDAGATSTRLILDRQEAS